MSALITRANTSFYSPEFIYVKCSNRQKVQTSMGNGLT